MSAVGSMQPGTAKDAEPVKELLQPEANVKAFITVLPFQTKVAVAPFQPSQYESTPLNVNAPEAKLQRVMVVGAPPVQVVPAASVIDQLISLAQLPAVTVNVATLPVFNVAVASVPEVKVQLLRITSPLETRVTVA